MTAARRLKLAGIVAIVVALPAPPEAQTGPSAEVVERTMVSVVQIRAESCSGPSAKGSGFVWRETKFVVTALHVVAGCSNVRVYFERPRPLPWKTARIVRIIGALDLALLEIDDAPPATPLSQRRDRPDPNQLYRAIGFSGQQPSMGDVPLSLSSGLDRLVNFLDSATLAELQKTTRINQDGRIIRFATPLNPGMSGGPIIDRDGLVIAVVGGGLDHLPAPPSWGWPSDGLSELLSSRETVSTSALLRPKPLFAVEQPSSVGETRTCGNLDFRLSARRSFADSERASDDPPRVQNVVRASTRPREEIDRFSFDVWRNDSSGATVLVPAGANLIEHSKGYCSAQTSGRFQQFIWGSSVPDRQTAERFSLEFEQGFGIDRFGPVVQFDPQLTTPGPSTGTARTDGAIFVRKGVITNLNSAFTHQFFTEMTRGESFVGVQIVNGIYPQMMGRAFCTLNPSQLQCEGYLEELLEWTAFILAAQLSTYPAF